MSERTCRTLIPDILKNLRGSFQTLKDTFFVGIYVLNCMSEIMLAPYSNLVVLTVVVGSNHGSR